MTRTSKTRRGFSMVELLIVVAISMLLIAITIPFIRPALENNKLREAARQLNTFFVGAKARAAENGRPFGVRLVRSSVDGTGDPNDCYRLQYVEVPPAYSGDLDNATITVGPRQPGLSPISAANPYLVYANSGLSFSAWLAPNPMAPALDQTLNSQLLTSSVSQFAVTGSESVKEAWDRAMKNAAISPGDSIRFGFQGVTYLIVDMYLDTTAAQPTPRLTLAPINGAGPLNGGVAYTHWPPNPGVGFNQPYAMPGGQVKQFQILRKPRVSGGTMIELPSDTSIDLSMSGLSIAGNDFFGSYDPVDIINNSYTNTTYADTRPIDIVFDPSGQVHMIAFGGIIQPANASIYLFVARTENVVSGVGGRGAANFPNSTPGAELALSQNLINNDSLWVAVQYPTGSILTAENLGSGAPNLGLARDLVRSGVAKGSR